MKNLKKVIFALMVVFLVVGFIGCKTESDPPKAPVVTNNFKGNVFVAVSSVESWSGIWGYIEFIDETNGKMGISNYDEAGDPIITEQPFTYSVTDDVATLKATMEGEESTVTTSKLTDGIFTFSTEDVDEETGETYSILITCTKGDKSLFDVWTVLYEEQEQMKDFFYEFEDYVEVLVEGDDYSKDDTTKTITLTESGWGKVQDLMGGGSEDEEGTSEEWTIQNPAGDFLETFESLEAANEYATENGLVLNVDYTMDFDAQIIRLTYAGLDKLFGEESTIYKTFYNGHELDRTFGNLEEFETYASVVVEPALIEGTDYSIDEENRRIILTDSGFEKMQGRTLVVKYNDVEIDYEFYSWKELEIFATEHNLIQETDYIIDDVNWVITLTDAGAEKLGMGGGSEEEGSGEVTGETWTVLNPAGDFLETFDSLEAAQAYAEENGLTFGDDFTMNNENQTITLTDAGWDKVQAAMDDTEGGDSGEVYYYMHNGELYGGQNTLEDFLYEVELYDLVEGTDYEIDHENMCINFTDSGCAKLEG